MIKERGLVKRKLENMPKNLKASFSIEAAIIIPLFLFMTAYCIQTAIDMYQQTKTQVEAKKLEEMWVIDDFYRFEILKEVKNDK